jgi:hypothetical protein
MDAEQTIGEIEFFERIFAAPNTSDLAAANRNVRSQPVVSPLAAVRSLLPE